MACIRWAETATWPAVLRRLYGRARHGARPSGEPLLSMAGPWRHRWPRGGVVRTYACEHAAGRARVCQPTLTRDKLRRV